VPLVNVFQHPIPRYPNACVARSSGYNVPLKLEGQVDAKGLVDRLPGRCHVTSHRHSLINLIDDRLSLVSFLLHLHHIRLYPLAVALN
jgi:hypothetical protein